MNTGSALARFTITLSQAVTEPVQVEWFTSDGTAKAGVDYAANKGTVVFSPGETAKTVDILVYGRAVGTEARSFFVEMQPPTNAILGASIGECIITVDTSGSTPITAIIVPTGPKGEKGDPGENGISPDPAEIAIEVAPLIDVGATVLTAEGTETLGHPDETTVKAVARRVAYSSAAKIATATLADGDNLIGQSDLTGDVVDMSHPELHPRILRSGAFISPDWSVQPDGKFLIKSAIAGDVLYVCQYDFQSRRRINSNTREVWRRSLAEAGLNLVDGSFESGATVTTNTDAVWHIAGGQCYIWGGTLPKTVGHDSTPVGSGGISGTAWKSVEDSTLRGDLSSSSGAGEIGTADGVSVQDSLDDMNLSIKKIDSRHSKRKVMETNWSFPDYSTLLSTYGYSILIPQGLAVDANYYYVAYTTNNSGGSNMWHWVALFDRVTNAYVSCFYIPNTVATSYPESLYVRSNGGTRTIYTTANGSAIGYDITTMPANMGAVGTSVFTKSGVSAFAPSDKGLGCFMADFEDKFITQVDWSGAVIGIVTLGDTVQTLTGKPSPYTSTRTKIQSRIISGGKLIMAGGAQYKNEDPLQNKLPAFAPSYLSVNGDGTLDSIDVYDPSQFLVKVAGVTTAHAIENEGIAESPEGNIYSLWYYEIQSPYAIKMFIVEERSVHDSAVNLASDAQNVLLGGGFKQNIIRSYDNTRFNPYTGAVYSNCEAVCEMMRNGLIDGPLTMYVSGTFYFNQGNTQIVPSGSKIVFTRINAGTVFMEVGGPSFYTRVTSTALGQLTFSKVQTGGLDTDPWFGTGDFVILGFGGNGVIATRRAGTAQSVHYRFQNANGTVGTIETTSNATLFNTSSDIRQKNIIGEVDGMALVRAIVEGGGVKVAEFKNDKGNNYPMLIAQPVAEHLPTAVSMGEDGFLDVDYSKLVPVLLKAIYELGK